MRVPVSWLRDFIESDAEPQTFANALTARGFTVDSISPQPTVERIVVGRIERLARHPNADRLQVSTVDVGAQRLQIVTGATNVAVGDKVPIALAGAVVYERGTSNGMPAQTKRIEPSTLRGVESRGMMCSPEELALPGHFEDGILVMEEDAPVGKDFWQVARFGDAVLDVEVPSNRPDGLSIIGLAREAAAGLHARFRLPSLDTADSAASGADSPIGVAIEDSSICRRLLGQFFWNVRNGRSPMWMVLRLGAAGVRSLNLLVDISNFVQLETAQPLHFYDAAKIRGGCIVARSARKDETVVTLDGVKRTLTDWMPVIADNEGAVGIAGIMGGKESAVSDQTHDLFAESPNFVGAKIRRAAIALGLRTQGALRHEKDLPLELPEVGRRRAAQLLMAAGAQPSRVIEAGVQPGPLRRVRARVARVNGVLGTGFSAAQMKEALRAVELEPSGENEFEVTIPYWRTDVTEEVDVIEEIARGIGYDAIPEVRTVAAPQSLDQGQYDQEMLLSRAFAALGYREVVSISLQGVRTVTAWERSSLDFWKDVVKVVNPLSEDQRFLRPSLLPGLLSAAQKAWPQADGALQLFEIGHIFHPKKEPADEGEPEGNASAGVYVDQGVLEWPSLAGIAAFEASSDAEVLDRKLLRVKGDLESVFASLGICELATDQRQRTYFHPAASANLRAGARVVAKFGRVHPRLAKAFELPESTYAFAVYLENLPQRKPIAQFSALPKFPATKRDIAVVVERDVAAGQLMDAVRESRAAFLESVRAFDEYEGKQIAVGKKSVALTITLRKHDATITDEEANASVEWIVRTLAQRFAATLRA